MLKKERKKERKKVVTASKVAKSVYNEIKETRKDDESRRESTVQKLAGDFLGVQGVVILYIFLFMLALYVVAKIAGLVGVI